MLQREESSSFVMFSIFLFTTRLNLAAGITFFVGRLLHLIYHILTPVQARRIKRHINPLNTSNNQMDNRCITVSASIPHAGEVAAHDGSGSFRS